MGSPCQLSRSEVCKIRYQKSLWFRALADSFCLMSDRGYKGLEYVYVCEDKPEKSVRQMIEAVHSQIKVFNGVSRWGILQLHLLTFRVILLDIVFSGNPRCLDNFSPQVCIFI